MITTSVADLRAHLSDYISQAQNEYVQITSNGEVVAALVSPKEIKYNALQSLRGCLKGIEVDEDTIKQERLSKI